MVVSLSEELNAHTSSIEDTVFVKGIVETRKRS